MIMKKLLSLLSIFAILFSLTHNSVLAISRYSEWKSKIVTNEAWVTKAILIKLMKDKWLTKSGLSYIIWQKNVTRADLLQLKSWTRSQKLWVLDKMTSWGLSVAQLTHMKNNWWLTQAWLWMIGWAWNIQVSWDFLQAISAWSYKINFEDINANNAWTVMQKWSWKNNLPTEFILEKWVKLKIDKEEYSKKLVKLSNVNKNKASLEMQWIWVNYIEPELRLLPDRVQVIEKVELTYNNNTQLEKIKADVYGWSDFELSNSAISAIEGNKLQKTGNNKYISAETKSREQLKKTLLWDESKAPKSTVEYEQWVVDGLKELCLQSEAEGGFWKKASDCTDAKIRTEIENGAKVLTVEEKVEFSIIPPSSIGWDFNLLKMDPKDVRISRNQILTIFENYWIMMEQINDPIEYPFEAQEARVLEENPFNDAHCENRHAANPDLIDDCKNLIKKKNRTTREIYTKNLLNGFTLWESNSYTFSDSIRVWVRKWKKTIAKASITFYYSYWFGLRFPIQSKVIVEDSMMDDFWWNSRDYRVAIWLKTLNGTWAYYNSVWLPDEKIFDWKEFVMEFGAWFKVYLRAIWVGVIIDEDIGLMSVIARLFRDKLINDLNIDPELVDDIIENNKFDKGRDFRPPLAWDDRVSLFDVSTEIPLYSWAVIEVFVEIILESFIDWEIKVDCTDINSVGWCNDSTLLYDKDSTTDVAPLGNNTPWMKWKEYSSTATYNDEWRDEDILGFYNNYWVTLDNFRYIPVITLDAFLRWWARIYIPIYWWKTFKTDKYKIFSMELDIESDLWGTHDWTSWFVDATLKNKIYWSSALVDVFPSVIGMVWNWTSKAELRIRTNQWQSTYDMYTIHEVDRNMSINEALTRNPYCRNAADWLPANGTQWEENTVVWDDATTDLVASKSFDLRARWCALNWKMSEVTTRIVDLENVAFDVTYRASDSDGRYRTYIQWSEISTDSDIELLNDFSRKWMKIKYTLDWITPNCTNRGTLYNDMFDLDDLWKNRLDANFNVTLKAIACNSNNWTLWEIFTKVYSVKNKSFDPVINLDDDTPMMRLSSEAYTRTQGYYTYITYWFVREDPTCNDEHRVNVRWGGIQVSNLDTPIWFVQWATIKAKTCIRNVWWTLSFSSDIITKSTDAYHDWRDDRAVNWNNPLNALDEVMMEDIYWWFDWQLTNPWLMWGLNNLLADGSIDLWAINGMNMLMMWGDMWGPWMWALWGMKNMSNMQMKSWFRTMMAWWQISRKWLSSMNTMIKWDKATLKWLIELAALYNQYGVSYSSKVEINKDMKKNEDKKQFKQKEQQFTKVEEKWKASSNDEYVNEKLTEINDCFKNTYASHLSNIEKTIETFENNRDKSKDEKTKQKYQKAIDKLEEIKELFLERYKHILDYENGVYESATIVETEVVSKYIIQIPVSTYSDALDTKEALESLIDRWYYSISGPINIVENEKDSWYFVQIYEFDSESEWESFVSEMYFTIHMDGDFSNLDIFTWYSIVESE